MTKYQQQQQFMHLLKNKKVDLKQYLEKMRNNKSNYSLPKKINDLHSHRQSKDFRSLDSQGNKKKQTSIFQSKDRLDQRTKKIEPRYQYYPNDNNSTQFSYSHYDANKYGNNYSNNFNGNSFSQLGYFHQPLYTSRMMPHNYQYSQIQPYTSYTPYNNFIKSQVIAQTNFTQPDYQNSNQRTIKNNNIPIERKIQRKIQSVQSITDLKTVEASKSLQKKSQSLQHLPQMPILQQRTEKKQKIAKKNRIDKKNKKIDQKVRKLQFVPKSTQETIYPTIEIEKVRPIDADNCTQTQAFYPAIDKNSLSTFSLTPTPTPTSACPKQSDKQQKQLIKNIKSQLRKYSTQEHIFGHNRLKVNKFFKKGEIVVNLLYDLLENELVIQNDLQSINNWITSIEKTI